MTHDPPYDPNARRDTPLALKLKERIRRDGPISVRDFMSACLSDPEHGYYVKQPAIGSTGDFITAPEISQMFGELVGLWCVAVWQQMGSPAPFNLVEFGPGRGTLMRDALRAMRIRRDARAAARVIMVETSAPLEEAQRAAMADETISAEWPGQFGRTSNAELPAIIIGNEFLDTEPIDQVIRLDDGWAHRRVGIDENQRLAFETGARCAPEAASHLSRRFENANPSDICEITSLDQNFADGLLNGPRLMSALLIDYGHTQSAPGETLQAVRNHRFEHPLTSPGEADLTAQVDFAQIIAALPSNRVVIDGPTTQSEFLGRLGIIERASKLMSTNPAKAGEIEASVARLIAPGGMGTRFKVIGLRSPGVPELPGFA